MPCYTLGMSAHLIWPDSWRKPSFNLAEGLVTAVPDLYLKIEEAHLKLILHAFYAAQNGLKRIVVLSQDTVVLVLCLHHWIRFASYWIEELWVTAGIADSSRYIPVHTLAVQLGEPTCKRLFAVHILIGCDYTSKFGTTSTALKVTPEVLLEDFGSGEVNIEDQVRLAEEYLVKVKKRWSLCKTTDELKDFIYNHSKANELPQTGNETRLHILRSLYSTNQMSNVLSPEQSTDPTLYGYEWMTSWSSKEAETPSLKRGEWNAGACRSSHRSSCSSCKYRRVSSTSECRNPIC